MRACRATFSLRSIACAGSKGMISAMAYAPRHPQNFDCKVSNFFEKMLVKNLDWNFSWNFTPSEKCKIRSRQIQTQIASRFHS